MQIKDNQFNPNNFPSFDGKPCPEGMVLVPFVLLEDRVKAYKETNFIITNSFWISIGNNKVHVMYIPVYKDKAKEEMKSFNKEVKEFITKGHKKHTTRNIEGEIVELPSEVSLDEILEKANSDDDIGFDPTGTRKYDNYLSTLLTIKDLAIEVDKQIPNGAKTLMMLASDLPKKEIIKQIDFHKGRTQAIKQVDKIQQTAKVIYNQNYK